MAMEISMRISMAKRVKKQPINNEIFGIVFGSDQIFFFVCKTI
jgi:hypothetical protein